MTHPEVAYSSGWDTPADELARQLSVALPGPPSEWALSVESVHRASDKTPVSMVVVCTPNRGGSERWELTLPSDADDDHLNRSALVMTMRANIEEWWATRRGEALTEAMGRRIG